MKKRKTNKPRNIHPENRIDIEKIQQNIGPVLEEMREAERQNKKDRRVPREAFDIQITD
jgi:hypothetical protein